MARKRRRFTTEFKGRVALEALQGELPQPDPLGPRRCANPSISVSKAA